jgi:hypothetical protein
MQNFEDIQTLVEFLAKTATFMDKAFEDGELTITDLMSAIPLLRGINGLAKVNYPGVIAELPKLTEEEQAQLVEKIKDSLDLRDDSKELIVENIIEVLMAATSGLMQVVVNVKKMVGKE